MPPEDEKREAELKRLLEELKPARCGEAAALRNLEHDFGQLEVSIGIKNDNFSQRLDGLESAMAANMLVGKKSLEVSETTLLRLGERITLLEKIVLLYLS